jgi:Lrp/AsnC family transcriptional regulator, leucine-responsive regulatory protein
MGIDKSIDARDETILRELQKNGKLTVNELSEKVNLSPSPVGRRVRHLEKSGYIKGYAALVNEYALGFKFLCFGEA